MTFEDGHSGRDLARERLDGWKTEWERRIKAEKERDKARAGARLAFGRCREVEAERQKVADELYRIRADEPPRPLTADDITDEARERAYRAVAALSVSDWDDMSGVAKGRAMAIVEAVITEVTRPEPPERPEGAEDIEALIRDAENAGEGADNEALADYLAARLTDPTRKEA